MISASPTDAAAATAEPAWRVGGASVRGASHIRNGAPNEDAWLCQPASPGRPLTAAVADGHGAAVHFRSRQGAEIAVRAAAAVLDAQIDDADGGELAGAALARWRSEVRAHMAAHPYADAERRLAEPPPLSPYGATLIAAGLNDGVLALLQIGDGDLILGYPDGRLERPLPPGPALAGELTFSLCQEDALSSFRSATLWRDADGAWPDFVFMATDGVSKSFRSDDAFEAEIARLRVAARADWNDFLGQLPGWLSNVSNNGSGDDATLCVAVRPVPHTGA